MTSWARTALLTLAAIALVLVPLVHDADCQGQAPTHCPACMVGPLAAPAAPVTLADAGCLPPAGVPVLPPILGSSYAGPAEVAGRAPPAA